MFDFGVAKERKLRIKLAGLEAERDFLERIIKGEHQSWDRDKLRETLGEIAKIQAWLKGGE